MGNVSLQNRTPNTRLKSVLSNHQRRHHGKKIEKSHSWLIKNGFVLAGGRGTDGHCSPAASTNFGFTMAAGQGSRKNTCMRLLPVTVMYMLPVIGFTATPDGRINCRRHCLKILACPEIGTPSPQTRLSRCKPCFLRPGLCCHRNLLQSGSQPLVAMTGFPQSPQ
jgi:hypothetical protein